ncbi:hypothetical protein [Gordonia sihwensis]|uniref:hypothetical protein n=1 Tax=Gordonia TaxID=2053 RepID=UPI002417023F|nr:hypothetical protein [Gordonia sihwensis]WFN93698.1 hypothetical protein P5P27_03805 [Gordonia sihwensis]
MAKGLNPPYLVPEPEAITFQPWMLEQSGDTKPLGGSVDDWVTGTDLRISRGVTIELDSVRAQCNLPGDASLGLVVSWMSDSSKIRRRVFSTVLDASRKEIAVSLSGAEVGGTVRITTAVVLAADVAESAPGAPHRRGSVLVSDVVTVVLEGEGSMFPMAVVDFDMLPYDRRASWHVEMSTALDANFSSKFQVFVNEQDKALIKAIESDKPTKQQQSLLDQLSSGVMEAVLELAYAMKAQGDLTVGGFEEGTVGSVLSGLVEQTGDLDVGDITEPSQIGRRRSLFQGLARGLAVGRMF